MLFDKWDRKTLEYLGRINIEKEEATDKDYKFKEICAKSF